MVHQQKSRQHQGLQMKDRLEFNALNGMQSAWRLTIPREGGRR
ncbi:hypothetical protein SynA1560_02031 [Synechococcus sp. A15-60]|nr:hypothetical protein SynA1560_02031 [Synechococcus sp. A15-60]